MSNSLSFLKPSFSSSLSYASQRIRTRLDVQLKRLARCNVKVTHFSKKMFIILLKRWKLTMSQKIIHSDSLYKQLWNWTIVISIIAQDLQRRTCEYQVRLKIKKILRIRRNISLRKLNHYKKANRLPIQCQKMNSWTMMKNQSSLNFLN